MEWLLNKIELFCNLSYVFMKKMYYKFKYGKRVKFGKKINFRKGFKLYISDKNGYVEIGDNTFFNQYCSITCMKKIYIGNNNLFGENCKIYDHNHLFNSLDKKRGSNFTSNEILIGNNNWFGTNNVILSKTKIGDNNVFAAGCIINSEFNNDKIIKADIKYQETEISYR